MVWEQDRVGRIPRYGHELYDYYFTHMECGLANRPPQKRARVLHSAIFLVPAILTIHPECALGSRSHWQSLPVSVSHTHPINVTECMFYRLSLKH